MAVVSLAHPRRPKATLSTAPPHARGVISTAALLGILTLIEALLIIAVVAGGIGIGAEGSQGKGPDHPPPPRPVPAGAAVQWPPG